MTTNNALQPILQALQQKARQPRRGCQYTQEELAVLRKYKDEYRRTTSHKERDKLLRQSIFVDIFNHWDSKKVELTECVVRQRAKV